MLYKKKLNHQLKTSSKKKYDYQSETHGDYYKFINMHSHQSDLILNNILFCLLVNNRLIRIFFIGYFFQTRLQGRRIYFRQRLKTTKNYYKDC